MIGIAVACRILRYAAKSAALNDLPYPSCGTTAASRSSIPRPAY
jgi:hypothetical protein